MISIFMTIVFYLIFFLLTLIYIRLKKNTRPRNIFFFMMIIVLIAYYISFLIFFDLDSSGRKFEFVANLFFLILCCLTTWNVFYSILWGFSGGIISDLYENKDIRTMEKVISLYDPNDGSNMNRMMKRRVPNLTEGGYITFHEETLHLTFKGHFIAIFTSLLQTFFNLGLGGGIH